MWDSVFNLFTFCSGLHHDNPKAAIQFITEKSVANIANGDGKTETEEGGRYDSGAENKSLRGNSMCMERCWQKTLQDSQTPRGVNDTVPDLATCFT